LDVDDGLAGGLVGLDVQERVAEVTQWVASADLDAEPPSRGLLDVQFHDVMGRLDEHSAQSWISLGQVVVGIGVEGDHDAIGRGHGQGPWCHVTADCVEDNVETTSEPLPVHGRAINNMSRPERLDQRPSTITGHCRHLRTEVHGKLAGQGPDPAGGGMDEDGLPRL